MISEVDLVVLTPTDAPLRSEVMTGVARQTGVKINLHRITAAPRPEDVNRWETIARGRNQAGPTGSAPWLMFLDDDVVLGDNCVATLVEQLRRRPLYGALAADYLGESHAGEQSGHVGMGATLFRRVAVRSIHFRWEQGKCECQCCCDDLRRMGMAIGYQARARASHLTGGDRRTHREPAVRHGAIDEPSTATPRILAAFDRRHFRHFRQRFLASLRSGGNNEQVTAVVYGLYPSERRALMREPRTDILPMPPSEISPARLRVKDFQAIIERLPAATPVAYWDAGDVIFQGSLQPLWETVRANPDKLLAVREPQPFTANVVATDWTLSIRDPKARRETLDLFRQSPVLNAGFAAGTAQAMLEYLRFASPAWNLPALAGSTDWGDQTGLNLYCHRHPDRWLEIEEGWNYCLAGRGKHEAYWDEQGRIASERGISIAVAHGNARTLPLLPWRAPRF
jgi:hypothetical protein